MNIKFRSNDNLSAWKLAKTNWLVQLVTKFVVFFTLASLLVIAFKWNHLPPMVPLWYSRAWGADQLAQPYWLFVLPLAALLIYFINLFLSIYVTAEYLIFTQVLFIASFLFNLLSFIALIKILFLVS